MKMRLLIGLMSFLLLLAGCATTAPAATENDAIVGTSPVETQPAVFTIVPTIHVTEESPLRPGIDCAWNWAMHDAPELQAQVDAAVQDANLTGATIGVSIFGEDCLDQSGAAVSFATMETDFEVAMQVADLADREAVGNQIADVFAVLAQFGPESTPGPQAGRITVTLHKGSESQILNIGVATALESVEQELRGEALMDFLEGPTF